MENKQITTQALVKYLGYANGYVTAFPKERSPLTYALHKLSDKYKSVREKYVKDRAQALEDAQCEFCSKDKDGNFIETSVEHQGQVIFRKKFKKEEEAKMKKAVDEAYEKIDSAKVDFEPHFVEVPKSLDITWVKALTGFVFKEMTPEEEEQWYLNQEVEAEK